MPCENVLIHCAAIARDVILTVAAAVGAFVALAGLRTWRHQLRGTAEYELARSMLRAVFSLRDSVRFLRSRVMRAHEFPSEGPSQQAGDVTQGQIAPDMEFAYQNRWIRVSEAMAQVDTQLFEAEVLWGDPFPTHAARIRRLIEDLRLNITEHLAFMRDPDLARRVGAEQINAVRTIAISQPENDGFARDFEDVLDQIQRVCRQHLRR
jgi:hypothetical protein